MPAMRWPARRLLIGFSVPFLMAADILSLVEHAILAALGRS